MRRECRERFPHHRLQRKPLVSDPDMHHDTCVRHVPWCMSGSLTNGGGENVPGIPGACTTRNFTYLARGPWGWDNQTLEHMRTLTPELVSRSWISNCIPQKYCGMWLHMHASDSCFWHKSFHVIRSIGYRRMYLSVHVLYTYCQTSNISPTLVDNKIVDHSDVVGAAPVKLHCHSRLHTWFQCIGLRKLKDEARNN